MSGTFTLQFDGQTTSDLDFDISADKMEAALQDLSTVNEVSVTREVVAHGFTWLVTFNKIAYAGDLAAELTASGVGIFPSSTAAVSVESLRHIIGRLPYHTIVTGLTSVPHFFRVSSYSENGVGDSTPAYFGTPDTVSLTPSTQVPMPPKNATVSVTTSSSVTVLWEAPQSTGGNAITSYTVEWDILDSFNSVCAAGDCKDLTVLGSGTSSTTSYVIEDLVPGQEYFVRVKATSASGSGQVTLALPSPIRPAAVPEAPHAVVLLTDDDATLRVEFAEPEAVAPFGSNGAPIERYKIEWAQRVHEVQKITIQSIAGAITAGQYRLVFSDGMSPTPNLYTTPSCIDWNAPASDIEAQLNSLAGVDGVSVQRAGDASALHNFGYEYTVTFDGLYAVSGNMEELTFSTAGCASWANKGSDSATYTVTTQVEGVAGAEPEVVELVTAASAQLGGTMALSFSYEGTMTEVVCEIGRAHV